MNTPHAELGTVVAENSLRLLGHDTHQHSAPELVYVVTGQAHLVVDGRPVHLSARESLWLAADVPHSARYTDHSMVFGALLSGATRPAGRMQFLEPTPRLHQLMVVILGAAPTSEEQIRPFRHELDALLSTMHSDHFSVRMPQHPAARRVAHAAPTSPLTLGELADSAGISSRQLQRVFVEESGMSLGRWRTRARLNRAIRALRGGCSLVASAHGAGYTTRNGLLQALSRETGLEISVLSTDAVGALDRDRAGQQRRETALTA